MRRRPLLSAAGIGAASLAAGAWWSVRGDNAGGDQAASLWALTFERAVGGPLAMTELRGRPLVVNFWATWCEPCVREMPALDRFARDFAARGWQVLGLAIDEADKVGAFLSRVQISFPVVLGAAQGLPLSRRLGNDRGGLPFTVVFSAAGRIIERRTGETQYADLVAWAARA